MPGFQLMFHIAHIGVKIVFSPKRATLPENLIRLAGGVAFQFLDDFGQRCIANFEEQMNVIGHDDPCEQVIPLCVMKPKGVFNELGDVRPAQMTFAPATIQIIFKLRAAFTIIFNVKQRLPLGTQRRWN